MDRRSFVYRFLAAFGLLGLLSSKVVTAKVKQTKPGAPTNVTAKAVGSSAVVSFQPPTNLGNDGPVTYHVTGRKVV